MSRRLSANKNSAQSLMSDLPGGGRSIRRPFSQSPSIVDVTYVHSDDFSQIARRESSHVLAALTYGSVSQTNQGKQGKGLDIHVNLPYFNQPSVVEVWETSASVLHDQFQDIRLAVSDKVVLGCLEIPQSQDRPLEDVTRQAYEHIFEYCTRSGFPHLLRMWNYFPNINEEQDGLERYKRFCIGRHQAFSAQYQDFWPRLPAASAVGTSGGPFQVLFLAGVQAGVPVENPRQISAYAYPQMYGPKSPSFARATLFRSSRGAHLFVAGTASIVGHATQHHEDPTQQTLETLCNIETILTRVREDNHELMNGTCSEGLLKVFVRKLEDILTVRQALECHKLGQNPVIFVQADMCRKELLVEIEGIWSWAL